MTTLWFRILIKLKLIKRDRQRHRAWEAEHREKSCFLPVIRPGLFQEPESFRMKWAEIEFYVSSIHVAYAPCSNGRGVKTHIAHTWVAPWTKHRHATQRDVQCAQQYLPIKCWKYYLKSCPGVVCNVCRPLNNWMKALICIVCTRRIPHFIEWHQLKYSTVNDAKRSIASSASSRSSPHQFNNF